MTDRAAALPRAGLGFVVGGGVALAVELLARAIAAAVNAGWPSPDANIGLGLLMLAFEVVGIPLGVWLVLRRLRVRGAALVALGTPVVFLVALFASPIDPASLASALVEAAAVAVYTGAATWVATATAPGASNP